MKSLLVLSALLLSTAASAATLPAALGEVFAREIGARCAVSNVQEAGTFFRSEKYDQGLFDHFYTTTYTAKAMFDGTHPVITTIVVHGIVDAATGANEVLEIKADVAGVCR